MLFSDLGKEFDAYVAVGLAVPTAETRPAPFAQVNGWIQALGQETVYPAATSLSTLLGRGPTEGEAVVKKRGRRSAARKRWSVFLGGGALLLLVLVGFWSAIWPYLLGAGVLGGLGTGSWWLWRTDRRVRGRDRQWRRQDAIQAGHRRLAEVDQMSGTEFEELVAALCRRDGCTDIQRAGGAGDNGADVTGRLPDGRTMIIQCKRYTPRSTIAPREVRDLLGSKTHFGADLAVFVTTTRFSRQSEDLCVHNDILAIHRDHLGLWNNGASLASLIAVNGAGQGDQRHRAQWNKTYGKSPQPRRRRGGTRDEEGR
ncbi:restriction endonuclease [Streptomyces sp. NBC_01537]|uniref:restriction endonuclease n=1 Tax=Streptomyces sp. NBC_01537 TaxID=2903896 RepID=UPI0038678614